jgi:hypothetical protein
MTMLTHPPVGESAENGEGLIRGSAGAVRGVDIRPDDGVSGAIAHRSFRITPEAGRPVKGSVL